MNQEALTVMERLSGEWCSKFVQHCRDNKTQKEALQRLLINLLDVVEQGPFDEVFCRASAELEKASEW